MEESIIIVFDDEREVWRINADTADSLERAVGFAMGYCAESRKPLRIRGFLGNAPDWEFTMSKAYFSGV